MFENLETVLKSFELMGMGMGAIFLVIAIIYLAVNLMLRFTK